MSAQNQSALATEWPFNVVSVRLSAVPRIDTFSFSPTWPAAPPAVVLTPGTRDNESATFLSGILPMSSAVMISTTESALRFWLMDRSNAPRMPDTVTEFNSASALEADGWACAAATLSKVSATAVAIGVGMSFMLSFSSIGQGGPLGNKNLFFHLSMRLETRVA